MTAEEILKKPYARRLIPDQDGGFVASIQEFPGLVAEGETSDEALRNLEEAAESWIKAVQEAGEEVPDPISFHGFSGKVALRIPRGLHKRSTEMASSEGCSLNQWFTTAISHYLGGREATHRAVDIVFKSYSLSITTHNYIGPRYEIFGGAITGQNFYGPTGAVPTIATGVAAGYLSGLSTAATGIVGVDHG